MMLKKKKKKILYYNLFNIQVKCSFTVKHYQVGSEYVLNAVKFEIMFL